jgi:hypothetical protein
MWLQAPVLAFSKRHATTPTLSVYVTGRLSAPSMRNAARVVMRQRIEAARATRHVDGGAPELFEQCVTLLEQHLPSDAALHRLGTWFCFITASGDVVSGSVPEAIDASVSWDVGPAIVPLLSAGAPTPAFVLPIDQEHARLCRLEDDNLVTLHDEEVEPLVVEGDHMGAQPRQGYHHGTTGETLTERTQRRRRAKRDRFQTSVRRLVESTVGDTGVLVIGGSNEAAHALVGTLSAPLARRTTLATELRFETGSAHAAMQARTALHCLADRNLGHWFDVLREERLGAGRSASGPPDVERALVQGDVAQLVLSRTFARRHARGAHTFALRAIAEGAEVYVASLDAAARLDEQASGIAAELRFALPPA